MQKIKQQQKNNEISWAGYFVKRFISKRHKKVIKYVPQGKLCNE